MKIMKTTEAVGHILCHDITQIIPGVKKGVLFKKGHIIKQEDIPKLLDVGKENIYIWEYNADVMHEDEAAQILCECCINENMYTSTEIREGRIDIYASCDGLFEINIDMLNELNSIDEIVVATVPSSFPVKKGNKIAGMRVVPIVINRNKMEQIRNNFSKILKLTPYKNFKVSIVTTGSEVYHGRIKDAFLPVLKSKIDNYHLDFIQQVIVDDDKEMITTAIRNQLDKGANMILCTGGMSVDPDDITPSAIMDLGGNLITYGSPVLPGAMFLLAYLGDVPILGLPGCVMYGKVTVLDIVFPKILTGNKLNKSDISKLGAGGLCLNCDICHFPICTFGLSV